MGNKITPRSLVKMKAAGEKIDHVWGDWEITRKTHVFEKRDASTIVFPVTVAPDKEVVIEYSVRIK